MKNITLALFSFAVLAGSAVAGPLVARPVDATQVIASPVFRDQELFFDLYGSYLKHHERDCDCTSKHDGFGGGFAIGDYFAYYLGARFDVNFSTVDEAKTTLAGDLMIRYPIQDSQVAPYAFVGGGVLAVNGEHGFVHVGAGLEWRINPNFGIFGEGSYAWVSQDTTTDNLTVKVGMRFSY